jgi:putative ABC transport system permease protein
METLTKDIRYAIRGLLKRPAFTAIVVLVLALGIGANTAIFSVVNAVLLRSLPYKEPGRLVKPAMIRTGTNQPPFNIAYADFLDWQKETQVFKHIAAYSEEKADVTGQGEPERVASAIVSEAYFAVMGAPPLLGRTFSTEENKAGGAPVAVISYRFWQRRFGGNKNVMGQTITATGQPFTIIGVMPLNSQYPDTTDIWVPLNFMVGPALPPDLMRRDNFNLQAIARLQPGVSLEQANALLATIARRLEQEHPELRKGLSTQAFPLDEWIVGKQLRTTLLVLLGAVGLVLLIACVNVANLLLARAARQEREIAIRLALGAGRWRLIRQLLTESLLLALLGGVSGLLLALWGTDLVIRLAPADIPRLKEVSVDGRVLGFALLSSFFTAIAVGLIPALQASKTDVKEWLKESSRGASGGLRGQRARSVLVIAEVALSLVLLIGAGLMIKSFARLQRIDLGFNSNNVLTMELNLPLARYPQNEAVNAAYRSVIERIKSVPDVQAVAAVSALPLNGGGSYLGRAFLREGQPAPPAGPEYLAMWNVVTPDYFKAMGMTLLRGRAFTEHDVARSAPVIIINETLTRQMFTNENPLGKRIKSWRDEGQLREIVGVVQDFHYWGRDDQPVGLVYIPHSQDAWRAMVLSIRAGSDPAGLTDTIRQAVWSFDKDLAVANVQTIHKVVFDSTARSRFSTLLLSLLATVALVLAAVGLYGVMSYLVTQRTHELGIRMALGARATDVLKLVVRNAMTLTLIGVAFGIVGAFGLTRLLSSLLFDVTPTDAATYATVSVGLIAVALLACYIPARRATKVDPLAALRYE